MNELKARRLRAQIEALRKKGSVPHAELERIARGVGRKLNPKRGKHPIWVAQGRQALSIPRHSKPCGKGLAHKILDFLEDELDELEEEPTGDP